MGRDLRYGVQDLWAHCWHTPWLARWRIRAYISHHRRTCHSKASSKDAVFRRRNDILSTHLWHFPTLRLVPIDSVTCRVSHVSCSYSAARWVQPSFGAAVSGLPLSHVSRLIFRVAKVGWVCKIQIYSVFRGTPNVLSLSVELFLREWTSDANEYLK